jgi:hydrogenase/urease accessory protein HupE
MMSTTAKLISTGILMGIVHVLTGPDHLSALVTLCGIKRHTRREAFCLGENTNY